MTHKGLLDKYLGIEIKDLFSYKEQIFQSVQELPGKLIVKEYPTKSASTNTLKLHLEKLKLRVLNQIRLLLTTVIFFVLFLIKRRRDKNLKLFMKNCEV